MDVHIYDKVDIPTHSNTAHSPPTRRHISLAACTAASKTKANDWLAVSTVQILLSNFD